MDTVCGTGRGAARGDLVRVAYTGRLADGRTFDASAGVVVPLGAGQAIAGWEQGLVGMREGGERRLEIPPALAFGDGGLPGRVPPNATVVYEVRLLDVREPAQPFGQVSDAP